MSINQTIQDIRYEKLYIFLSAYFHTYDYVHIHTYTIYIYIRCKDINIYHSSIYLNIFYLLSIHSWKYLTINSSIHISIYKYNYLSRDNKDKMSETRLDLSIEIFSIYLSIHLFIFLSTNLSIYTHFYLPNYLL